MKKFVAVLAVFCALCFAVPQAMAFGDIKTYNYDYDIDANGGTATANQQQQQKQAQQQQQQQAQGQLQFNKNYNKDVNVNIVEAPDMTPVGDGLTNMGNSIKQGMNNQAKATVAAEVIDEIGDNIEQHQIQQGENFRQENQIEHEAEMQNKQHAHESLMNSEQLATSESIEEKRDAALIEAAKQSRDFANQLDPYTEQGPADFRGPWNAGPQVMKASEIITYQKVWKYDSVKKAKSQVFEGVRVKYRRIADSPIAPAASDRVSILTKGERGLIDKGTKTLIGFMYAEARGDQADMVLVLQKAATEICEKGGNVAVLMGEGFTSVVDAKGGGVGFSYTNSFISDDAKRSGGGSGGTGFSVHKSGPETKPWVQFAVYRWTSEEKAE